ncbi:lytic murein transglycosylase, partial [Polaromonas sp.]|uniref:lytic murein transglycosylase n=1 Tax=Polaromonas sp. TaxID=1869339 RepID=UPI0025E1213C
MQTPSRFPASARCWLVHALLAIFAVAGCASAPSVQTKAPAPSTVGASPTPAVSDEVEHSQKFARWVTEFSTIARAAGIDEATLKIAFDNVRLVPRVIESNRARPEFTRTVWDYLDGALSTQRIDRGQDKLLQLRPEVDTIAARYGVPTEVLVAIWGME